MCCLYMGPLSVKHPQGKRGKEVPQTTLASPFTSEQTWEKSAPNYPGKHLQVVNNTPLPPLQAMHIWKERIPKRGSP